MRPKAYAKLLAEETPEERVVEKRRDGLLDLVTDVNVHDRGRRFTTGAADCLTLPRSWERP